MRVVKLFSWHISHHYSYELHHLNVIFTTYTCGVYWTRENSYRYFSSSEYRPFCVVSTGRPVKTIAFSSHIILIFRLLGLPILTKRPSTLAFKSGICYNTRNLPGRRVSTSQVDLDQTCYAFTCWKNRS